MALKTRIINPRRIGRTFEAMEDLKRAREVLAANPNPRHQINEIRSLESVHRNILKTGDLDRFH